MYKFRAHISICLGIFLTPVQAAPVTWTIDSLLFDDGGTASGSFVYDADSNSYSNISIVTTAGSLLGGEIYSYLNTSPAASFGPHGLVVGTSQQADLTGTPSMLVTFTSDLTNAGGVVQLTGGVEAFCANAVCDAPMTPARWISSGQISAVPVPAAVWLFASGLGLLGWMRRNRTA